METEELSPEATQTETQTNTTTEPTLEDVYKSAQPEPQPQPRAEPAPQPRAEPAQINVPDPYDSVEFKAYMAREAQEKAQLREGLQAVTGFLTQQQAKEARSALEADISKAVETVAETVDAKPKLIEALLDAEAREDPRFKAAWEGRAKNPTHWNQVLKAAGKKFAEELSVKVDPKLVDAQRLRRQSQKHAASTTSQDESDNSGWDGLSEEEFQHRWNQAVGGG